MNKWIKIKDNKNPLIVRLLAQVGTFLFSNGVAVTS